MHITQYLSRLENGYHVLLQSLASNNSEVCFLRYPYYLLFSCCL